MTDAESKVMASVGTRVDPSTGLVQLDRDHPGFRDENYRRRRNEIAKLALAHREGDTVPDVSYTDDEHGVWHTIWQHVVPLHARYACREYIESTAIMPLDRQRIPQLREINTRLRPLTGFEMTPVAGLVSPHAFLLALERGRFCATQYMRHAAKPLYTPEPDVVHELVGHAVTLGHASFARMNRRFGERARRLGAEAAEAAEALVRVYWFTLEFGVLREAGRLKAYGAGLLSSYGEIGRFERESELRTFDLDEMARTPFDPTDYQRVLFVAPSFEHAERELEAWLGAR